MSKQWEVWVSNGNETSRFNARFTSRERADAEIRWYLRHGYKAGLILVLAGC